MEKIKTIIIDFIVLWGCFFVLALIAITVGIYDGDLKSYAILMAIMAVVAFIQSIFFPFNNKLAVLWLPSILLVCQCGAFWGADPTGTCREGASVIAQLCSPFIDKICTDIILSGNHSEKVCQLLFILDCTFFTWLYLLGVLSLAQFISNKIGRSSKREKIV